MGYFSNLELDVESMAADGYQAAEIAEALQITFDEVMAVLERLDTEYWAEHDGQPTEQEEWASFDADC
jgi:peptide methionine sulfoxide reductase MsrA